MHCSSCEPLLDRYLEGTLPPRKLADMRAHIASCEHCRALLEEVKVIDALLFTTKVPDLPSNFTFAVMAEVGTMPVMRASQHRIWSFLWLYLAASWVSAILFISVSGISPYALFNNAVSFANGLASRTGAAVNAAPHATPELAIFGFGVLGIDIFLAAAVAAVYFGVRPRLSAAIAYSRRSQQ